MRPLMCISGKYITYTTCGARMVVKAFHFFETFKCCSINVIILKTKIFQIFEVAINY